MRADGLTKEDLAQAAQVIEEVWARTIMEGRVPVTVEGIHANDLWNLVDKLKAASERAPSKHYVPSIPPPHTNLPR